MQKNVLLLLLLSFGFLFSKAQNCSSNVYFDTYIETQFEKAIAGKVADPAAIKRHILQHRLTSGERGKLEIKVYMVYQNVKKTSLSVKNAEKILKECAEGFDGCEIVLTQVNPIPTPFVFTDSEDSFTSVTNLLIAASTEKWLDEADIIIGVIGDSRPNLGGWAMSGRCNNQPARALIVRADMPDYVLAHEIGHNLGMIHDDTPSTLMKGDAISELPTRLGFENKKCYHATVNCEIKGVAYFELSGLALVEGNWLSWSPKGEQDNEGFWVERSFNYMDWGTLAFVNSKGTTNEQNNYNYLDKTKEKQSIYRIRYKDFTGKDTYSNNASVQRFGDLGIRLGKNPFAEKLDVLLDLSAENLPIKVFDETGRFCFSQNLQGGQNVLDFSSFSNGVYYLQINVEENPLVFRAIKIE